MCSVTVVDTPGAQNPELAGQSRGATFEELCHNYAQERLQLLFHQRTFARELERYKEVTGMPRAAIASSPLPEHPLHIPALIFYPGAAQDRSKQSSPDRMLSAAGFSPGSHGWWCLCWHLRPQPGFARQRARLGGDGLAGARGGGEDDCSCSPSAPTAQGNPSVHRGPPPHPASPCAVPAQQGTGTLGNPCLLPCPIESNTLTSCWSL